MFKRLLNEIDAVFDRDPAARSRLEVIFCYPGFHAMVFYRLSNKLWRMKLKFIARFISMFARFFTGIEIHPGATIGQRFFIDHGMGVVIGETAKIGDDVTMYHGVTLGGTSFEGGIRHPQIGSGVVIGAGAQLLGPIRVGSNARIGSNAVVVKDVPERATMVGVPARPVQMRDDQGIVTRIDPCFDAYGTDHGEMPDPVARMLENLAQEVISLKRKVDDLEGGSAETAQKWEVNL